MTTTISTPARTTGRRENADYYDVVVTYRTMPLRYRLHNEGDYGIDCLGAMPDCPPTWWGTDMDLLDLPAETIAALRTLWEALFLPARSVESLKRIEPHFDRASRRMEYDAYFGEEGHYLGTYATRQAAQAALDNHAYDLLRYGLLGDADLQINADELAEVA